MVLKISKEAIGVPKDVFRLNTDYQYFTEFLFREYWINFRKMRYRPHRLKMPYNAL